MSFIPTILLAYLVLAIQSGIAPFIGVGGATPNLLLPVVIFIALYASREPALIGVYVIGLMQDMLSQDPLGVYPLVYAFLAIVARMTQPTIHRDHWLTHILLGLAGGTLHGAILWLVSVRLGGQRYSLELIFNSAIYTAITTPIILRVLVKSKRLFGFQPDRRALQ